MATEVWMPFVIYCGKRNINDHVFNFVKKL